VLRLDQIKVVQGDFEIRANLAFGAQITALLGPSGAGKSTILNVIAGFSDPASGAIFWQDRDISHARPAARPVGIVFQDNNLFPHLNIQENLGLALTRGRPDAAQRKQISGALERVGLSGFERRKPAEMSGGQQSRAALARVLLQARPLMLLDEPFAALGPALKKRMLDLVAELCRETGMHAIMVSHDPADALRIADEAVVVAEGTVTMPVAVARLMDNPPAALQRYLGD